MKTWCLIAAIAALALVCVWQQLSLRESMERQREQIEAIERREERLERWFQLLPALIREELIRAEERQKEDRDAGED